MEKLCKKNRVYFIERKSPSSWPKKYEATFKAIEVLGDTKFQTYPTGSRVPLDEFWKVKVKEQAKLLVEQAERCVERNESTWRSHCENIVLARLSAEVAW